MSSSNAPPTPSWKATQERGSEQLMRVMAWIALHLGRSISRLLLHPIALYFVLTSGAARTASRAYLARALQRTPTWRDEYQHIFHFAAITLDRIYFLNNRSELFDLQIKDEENGALTRASSGVGMFLMGAHFGSFESVRLTGRQYPDLNMVLLMYEENAVKIQGMMAAINPDAHQEIVALGKANSMLKVRDHLQQGHLIGILADRSISEDATHSVNFLGEHAPFPTGPFRLAAMLRHPVFMMVGLYHGANRYEVCFELIADFSVVPENREQAVIKAVERYAERLAHFCRIAPYNWFNFYDFWQGHDEPPNALTKSLTKA
jgi:predicted LPLAT superfamily acyltransferase